MLHKHNPPDLSLAAALERPGGCWPMQVGAADELAPAWFSYLRLRIERAREAFATRNARRDLMQLDDRMLRDLGLTRSDLMSGDLQPSARRKER